MNEKKKSGFFGRKKAEELRKAYAKGYSDAGASWKKRALKGFNAQSGSPVEDIDFNNKTLRQRSRMLYMASPIASAAINTNRTKVVGSGLHMKCSIDAALLGLSDEAAREWQRKTEAEWKMWAEDRANCDALGLNNFYELQQLAIKSWLMSGDVFALMKRADSSPLNPYTLRLHLIEADRVSTPTELVSDVINITEGKTKDGHKIHDGVEVDENGKVVAYHICNVYPEQMTSENKEWIRVKARGERTGLPNILQVMDAERPDQYRGVSYLAPVIESLLQLRRYTDSELTAAIVQSYLTAWITSDIDQTSMPINETTDDSVSDSPNDYEMGPGTINVLAPGENVTLGNPNIPTAGFPDFTKAIIQQIGASRELPYDVLTKNFNASYSAAKGALEEAWETFKMFRSWFIDDFCKQTYETWLAEAVAIGRIKAPGFFADPLIRKAWSGSRWNGPAQTHLDPLKEANANEKAVQYGWKTNEQVTREYYGGEWDENAAIIEHEKTVLPQNQSNGGNQQNAE